VDRDAEQLLITALSGYKTGVAPTRTFPPTASRHFHQRIEKPGSVQSSIRMGKLAMNRNHQEYAEAVFVAHILGGYFGSRLMKNIREEKGLTYGIYASLHPLQHDGYLVIGADVNKENVDLTIDEISKELKNLRTQKISSEELHISKNHFIGSLQSEISTPFAHADKIKTIFLSGLPDDFYHNMVLTIDSITPDRIIEISTKHFHEDSLNQVAVG
jgi:predicted Zn-dependent peptidase